MEVRVTHVSGLQFEALARGHRIRCDQPWTLGGEDQGMTPPELLMASLGTCAAYYAAEYLRTRRLPVEGLGVQVVAGKAADPPRLANFRITVEAPAASDDRHREGVLRAIKKCLIHNTLLHSPQIEVRIGVPEPDTSPMPVVAAE